MAKTIIDAHNVSKTFNPKTIPVHAVQNVHVHIEEGEFVALVGPSGSGKSTLLNMMGGLDEPTEGTVFIDGVEITKLSENKLIDFRLHNIGFVFQSFNLIPVLTAKENVGFVLQLQHMPKEERDKRVLTLLEEVGLEDKINSKPGELSGGQQQRVAVARALASKPKIILADEPTANLDSKSAANLLDIMAKLNKEEKITFLFSTHDQRVIKKARRVITLVDGKVASDVQQTPS
ncbi:ABC transporter ATP-binding protein [Maribacter arcticus]|jgi:putative ABC transport system ATP-binding protein|uniref:ABC transporter ATP-binding protein n=1 Tax=Maribacter arcticus TaxID=561365 RepID=UPI002302736C|nr:ABC transporter ATP-binding protein [Maribacter arcticus]MDA9089832.1 ABC transporter ATP-binding protein [Maribacter arcticus]|tara:strand:+ start:265 stop:963 length:699 start_codon:yes stop_codon:yes gene_type:complete